MVAWGPVLAAGVSSAAGLAGGFLNRGLSQRDAMQAQSEFALRHQREQLLNMPRYEVQGLKRAGINPMLPYANGGGPSTSGSFTPGIAAPINPGFDLGASVGRGVSSAIDMKRTNSQVALQGSQVSEIAARINEINARTDLTKQQRENATVELRRIFADTMLKNAQGVLSSEQIKTLQAQRELIQSQAAVSKWTQLVEEARARMAKAGIPQAEGRAEIYSSAWGRFFQWLNEAGRSANPFADTFNKGFNR